MIDEDEILFSPVLIITIHEYRGDSPKSRKSSLLGGKSKIVRHLFQ